MVKWQFTVTQIQGSFFLTTKGFSALKLPTHGALQKGWNYAELGGITSITVSLISCYIIS